MNRVQQTMIRVAHLDKHLHKNPSALETTNDNCSVRLISIMETSSKTNRTTLACP